jgi:NTE family protein
MTKSALVLGGGGAWGAYEVGVAHFLFEDLARRLGRPPRISIFTGTSVGAINASTLAAYPDEPLKGVAQLASRWRELELDRMVRPDHCEVLALARAMLGGDGVAGGRGLLDPRPFQHLLFGSLPLDQLAAATRAGVDVAICATEVRSGLATLFVAGKAHPDLDGQPRPGTRVVRVDHIKLRHVLASAAVPLLLPPVEVDGRLYCDGSLRQHVPLSPAKRLGAERMVVVTTGGRRGPAHLEQEREEAYGPIFLLGRALEAVTVERVEDDLERLEQVNDLLAAGRRAFGDDFGERINRELRSAGKVPVKPIDLAVVRPSESLERLAADLVRSRGFKGRLRGSGGRLLERLRDSEGEHEAALLSFLLFDGAYASELMVLGREDARRQEDALAALLG